MGEYSFFTAEPLMYNNEGFAPFGPAHLAWLAVCAALILAAALVYRRLSERGRFIMRVLVALVPVVTVGSRDLFIILADRMNPHWYPLHVCNFCQLFMLVYALKPNRYMGGCIYVFGIIGGLMALLTPSWMYCPPLVWAVFCGFLGHASMLAYAAMLLAAGELDIRRSDVWMPMTFIVVYGVFAFCFNAMYGTNFAFLNGPSKVPLLKHVVAFFGDPWYVLPYALAVLVVCVLMYLPWRGNRAERG